MTVTQEAEKTRTLRVTFKARNGRRVERDFAITEIEATSAVERAAAVSRACATTDDRMVNWKVL